MFFFFVGVACRILNPGFKIQDSKKKESQALSLDEGSLERGSGFKQFCSQSWTLNPRTFAKFAQVTAYYCANCFITHGFSGTHKMRHHIYVYVHTRHTHMYTHTYTYTHVALHYIALHCIALHYATLHFSTLHYTTPHYITLHCIALHTYIYIYINRGTIDIDILVRHEGSGSKGS